MVNKLTDKQIHDLNTLDVIFLDVEMYSREGFTSGLLIIIREILKKFKTEGEMVGILSIANKHHSKHFKGLKNEGLCYRIDQEIPVFEYLLDSDLDAYSAEQVFSLLEELLKSIHPNVVVMNTPAVFLHENDIIFRRAANFFAGKVIHVLADQLFPTIDGGFPRNLVSRLYEEISMGEVIALTKKIQKVFFDHTGIKGNYFKNPFVIEEILVPEEKMQRKYVALVNVHPIKGIALFDKIAEMMPEEQFLVVKNWPDVPLYKPKTQNVTFVDFYSNPIDFYSQVKILLVPSLHEDGPTRVSIEALANGIPVVANRIGSIPEMGDDNVIFINPPIIRGCNMDGTILYPVVSEEDLTKTASEYCVAIKKLMLSKDFFLQYTKQPRKNALKYISDANQILKDLVLKWTEEVNSKEEIKLITASGMIPVYVKNIPQNIKSIAQPFEINKEKVWALDLPARKVKTSELKPLLDLLWWPRDGKLFQISPRQAIKDPHRYQDEIDRVERADLSCPIDVIINKGRFVILDGFHRLLKVVQNGDKEISIRVLPYERIKDVIDKERTYSSFHLDDWLKIAVDSEQKGVTQSVAVEQQVVSNELEGINIEQHRKKAVDRKVN